MKRTLLVITPIDHIENFSKKLKNNFNIIYFKNANQQQILKYANKAVYIFTNPNMSKIFFSSKLIKKFKILKCICTASTGTNHIDLNFAREKNINVISLRNKKNIIKKISSTAEHALALTLASIRNIFLSATDVRNGHWKYLPFCGKQLNHLTIGVIGYGRLGKIFANLCKGIFKNILVYEKNFKIKDSNQRFQCSLEKLLRNSDIISIHIHADSSNDNFLDKKKLDKVKKDVLIVNTSRGEVVNEIDMLNFLNKNNHAKYATDVLKNEITNKKENLILKYFKKNQSQILITPHIGGMTREAQYIAYNAALNELIILDKNLTND